MPEHVQRNMMVYVNMWQFRETLARLTALIAENERLRAAVHSATEIGELIGFLGNDTARIEAFRQECGDELLSRARAALSGDEGGV